jgi:hypothetical protein
MVKIEAISQLNKHSIFSYKMTIGSKNNYNSQIILSASVASKGMNRGRGLPRLHPLDPAITHGLASNLLIHLKQ